MVEIAGASCLWQPWCHCCVPSSPAARLGCVGQRGQAGMDGAQPGSLWEPSLGLCPQSWLRLPWFSWEGRSCASLCPALLAASCVLGSAAASASHLCPGHKCVLETNLPLGLCRGGASSAVAMGSLLLVFRLAAASTCARSRALCPLSLDWDLSLHAQAGGTGYHNLCPPWALSLRVVGRRGFIRVCLFFPLLFIYLF